MQRYSTLTLLLLLLTACLLCSTVSRAEETLATAPAVTITPTVGPPTTNVLVWGTGFDPYAAVDIYFDTTDLALATTNGAGAFGGNCATCGIAIQVPTGAVPGTHWITAVERYGQKAAQKSFLVRTDWAQFHFEPSHKGVNPFENVLGPYTIGNVGLHWYNSRPSHDVSPAVANGLVYSDGGAFPETGMYAFDAGTGALRWKYVTEPQWVTTSPAVVNGVVYFGTYWGGGYFYALNATTGNLLWRTNKEPAGSPVITDGIAYFGSSDKSLYALNATTGVELWHYPTTNYVSTPTVANGRVYFGGAYGDVNHWALYALDAKTKSFLWKFPTGGTTFFSTPAVANGMVFFGSGDGNLYALNATNGAFIWSFGNSDSVESSPAVVNGTVYYGGRSATTGEFKLYALKASSGQVKWEFTTAGYIHSSPAVANGVVYFGSDDGNLYALDAVSGELLWQYTTGAAIRSSPAVANGVVYVGSDDGNLYAFDLFGGLLAQKFKSPERPNPSLLRPNWELQPSTPLTRVPSDLERQVD